jgi:carotenoid cleavage dioxygenase-like enzyme
VDIRTLADDGSRRPGGRPVRLHPGHDRGGRGTVVLDHLDDTGTEFPRIDDRRTGRAHRYLTVAGRSGAVLQPGEHDRLYRYDMDSGSRDHVDTNAAVGEVVFAPRTGGTDELDGYYLALGTDVDSGVSSLNVWDAAAFPSPPVATVAIPQRVPNGLHGNWFPAG